MSLTSEWFGLEVDKFPKFTICKLLSIEAFPSCQNDFLKELTKFWPYKNESFLLRCIWWGGVMIFAGDDIPSKKAKMNFLPSYV